MKKISLLLTVLLLILSLTACGGAPSASSEQTPFQVVDAASSAVDTPSSPDSSLDLLSSKEEDELEAVGENGSGSHILIAYFTAAENSGVDAIASASFTTTNGTAVGRLRAVADMIRTETGGDLFSIQTATVYPADIGELIEYASQEQADDARPELTTHIENL